MKINENLKNFNENQRKSMCSCLSTSVRQKNRKQRAPFFVDWHTARESPSIPRTQCFPDSFLSFLVSFLLYFFLLSTSFWTIFQLPLAQTMATTATTEANDENDDNDIDDEKDNDDDDNDNKDDHDNDDK